MLVACLRCACFSQFNVCRLGQLCSGTVATRGAYLRRLLAFRHPTDPQTRVQHVLRPWPRSNASQRASFDIPAAFLARAASSVGSGLPGRAAVAGDPADAQASHPSGLLGPSVCEAPHCVASSSSQSIGDSLPPPEEEWTIEQLSVWFGDTGL
jgi:hypothetical protein